MNHLDLFSGIGGFALVARWMNWQTTAFVERDSFCQKVLNKNFPGVPVFDDITTFTYEKYKEIICQNLPKEVSQQEANCHYSIDILTGGFP